MKARNKLFQQFMVISSPYSLTIQIKASDTVCLTRSQQANVFLFSALMMELKEIDPPIGFQMINTGERSHHLRVPKLIIVTSF